MKITVLVKDLKAARVLKEIVSQKNSAGQMKVPITPPFLK